MGFLERGKTFLIQLIKTILLRTHLLSVDFPNDMEKGNERETKQGGVGGRGRKYTVGNCV